MNIILCATQRCGSTMIVEDMRNTGVLGVPGEYLIPWDPEKRRYGMEDVRRVQERGRTTNGVSAIKVMADQAARANRALASTKTTGKGPLPHFHDAFGTDATWVFVRREDVVAQAVSRVMARKTGINHATGDKDADHFAGNLMREYDPEYNASVKYDANTISIEVGAIAAANTYWRRFFEGIGVTPLELVYENYAYDPAMPHIDAIATAAGISSPDKKQRTMVKVGNRRNAEWADRYLRETAESNFFLRPR